MRKLFFISLASIAIIVVSLTSSRISSAASRSIKAESCSPVCGACDKKMRGTWRWWVELEDRTVSYNGTAVFTQNGSVVKAEGNNAWWFYGNVEANSVNLTMVVSGETVEGYVMRCEGHLMTSKTIAAFCHDSMNRVGSFTAVKQ